MKRYKNKRRLLASAQHICLVFFFHSTKARHKEMMPHSLDVMEEEVNVSTAFSLPLMVNNVRILTQKKEGLENKVILYSFQFSITYTFSSFLVLLFRIPRYKIPSCFTSVECQMESPLTEC